MNDIMNLKKLEKLRDNGKISASEFEEQSKVLYNKSVRAVEGKIIPKSGIVYIILAWFLGIIGIHNFYAGFWIRGLIQLGLVLTSWLFMFIPLIVVALWVFGELLFENKGANGLRMRGNRSVILGLRIAAIAWFVISIYYTYNNNEFIFQDSTVIVELPNS